MTDRTCRICGTPMVGAHVLRIYCSLTCRRRAERPAARTKPAESDCTVCGSTFKMPTDRGRRQLTCSDACRSERDAESRRRSIERDPNHGRGPYVPVVHPERSCVRCGSTYVGRSVSWCSRTCKDSDKKDRRRAAIKAARTERFSRVAVFDRDGWSCGICGGRIKRSLAYPHPKSVTLDHVIPLSLGGEHSMANTQAAHLDCNTRKSAGSLGPEQLRLIG